ncbi:MAG: DUF4932 domain-containing protein [Cytophagaceae bacterium]|nr:DUF4932 domain-containing protein [Gemmatimonadaceae bacterium]
MSTIVVRCCAVLVLLTTPVFAQEVVVQVDPRVELVSALFRSGGRREYNQGRVPRWNVALDSLFNANAGHAALPIARRLATQYNVGFFAPISLALHLRPAPALGVVPELATAASLHRTWTTYPDSTTAFVAAFASFWGESRFDAFLRAHSALTDTTRQRLRALVERGVVAPWFRRFWGDSSISRLTVMPGLTVATASYGLDVASPDGKREGYAVIGVTKTDVDGLPRFDSTDVHTVIHELNHPYVTAVLRRAPPSLRSVSDSLYRGVAAEMRRIGYGTADAMLNEALVRAAVIRYLRTTVSPSAAATEIDAQRREGFVWIADVAAALDEYDTNRDRYPGFDAFVPVLVERLRQAMAAPSSKP